jgi:hypothetical protein
MLTRKKGRNRYATEALAPPDHSLKDASWQVVVQLVSCHPVLLASMDGIGGGGPSPSHSAGALGQSVVQSPSSMQPTRMAM